MDLGFDYVSSPPQLPSGPGTTVHLSHGLHQWSPNWLPRFSPLPSNGLLPTAAWGSDLAKRRLDHVTPLFKTLQMLPFLQGKKPKTLKWPTRLHIIYSPLPTLLPLFLITSCLSHTPPSRASLVTYWSLHTRHASSLCHCAVPSSALNSHESSLPFLESLLKTYLLHEGLALHYRKLQLPTHNLIPLSQHYFSP